MSIYLFKTNSFWEEKKETSQMTSSFWKGFKAPTARCSYGMAQALEKYVNEWWMMASFLSFWGV